jgi:hypothetical protein
MDSGTIAVVISSPCLVALGLLCLLRPGAVQAYAIRASARWNPFLNWMKTPGYIWSLRMCGTLALFMAVLIVTGAIMGKGQ